MTASERIKTSCVYIGAIVGAGFATGKEIILFFGEGGCLAPLVTGAAMGLCAALFLYVGKVAAMLSGRGVLNGKAFNLVKYAFYGVVGMCMLLTMTTMTGGMQTVFGNSREGRLIGFFLAALCVAFSAYGSKAVGRINVALVPVLFALLAVLFLNGKKTLDLLPFNALKSVSYLSMNMLLGGCLTVKDGKRASGKDMLIVGVICAAVLGAMTFFVYETASLKPYSQMPVYAVCVEKGMGVVGAATVGIAILTTLAGAAKSLGDAIYMLVPSKAAVTSALLLITLASYGWDFAEAVNLFYPFIAAVASGVFALALAAFTVYAIRDKAKKLFDYRRNIR